MKKIVLGLLIGLVACFLTGCSSGDKSYDDSVKIGLFGAPAGH